MDRDYRVKLADLGEARELSAEIVEGQAHLTKNRGTPHWMAPEAFIGSNYDERVDVYSLGIVMWEILTSRRPFEDVSPWLIPAAVVERRQRPALVCVDLMPPPLLCTRCIPELWSRCPCNHFSFSRFVSCLFVLL